MRELVVKYLHKEMSRRRFVGNLTKAGITMTAAQGVLASVSSVSVAQTGPTPTPPAGAAGAARSARDRRTGDHRRPVRAFQGTGGAAFAEQLIASGVKYVFGNSASEDAPVLRGAGRPPAAQIHPHAARRARRRDGRRLHQGVGRAGDRDAGRGGRHGERHRPDDQRLQGADPAGRLLLPHRPDRPRGTRRLRGGRRTRSRSSSRSPSTPGWRAAPT